MYPHRLGQSMDNHRIVLVITCCRRNRDCNVSPCPENVVKSRFKLMHWSCTLKNHVTLNVFAHIIWKQSGRIARSIIILLDIICDIKTLHLQIKPQTSKRDHAWSLGWGPRCSNTQNDNSNAPSRFTAPTAQLENTSVSPIPLIGSKCVTQPDDTTTAGPCCGRFDFFSVLVEGIDTAHAIVVQEPPSQSAPSALSRCAVLHQPLKHWLVHMFCVLVCHVMLCCRHVNHHMYLSMHLSHVQQSHSNC